MTMVDVVSEDFWVDAPSGRLFARRWDSQYETGLELPPIVLMHDSLGSVELWREFPERLAKLTRRSVLAYDRLGFGRSDARRDQVPVDFIREEASTGFNCVKRAFALDQFVVLGHSVGAGMAVCIAGAYPDECEALITMSGQAFVEDRTISGIRAAKAQFSDPFNLARLARYHGHKATWVLSAWIDRWLDPDFASWNLDADLGSVKCPSLVLHGSRDEYGSVEHAERIADQSNGRSSMRLGDWGHVPHREAADEILSVVVDWLGSLPVKLT